MRVSDRGVRQIRLPARDGVLASCEYFSTERLTLNGRVRFVPQEQRMELLVVVEGRAEIAGQPAEARSVWFVAPECEPFEVAGSAILLRVSGPAG